MEFEPEEAVQILIAVMHGELDGNKVTTSERIRAATLLMRWYMEGITTEENDEPDDLSRAIWAYKAEDGKTNDTDGP